MLLLQDYKLEQLRLLMVLLQLLKDFQEHMALKQTELALTVRTRTMPTEAMDLRASYLKHGGQWRQGKETIANVGTCEDHIVATAPDVSNLRNCIPQDHKVGQERWDAAMGGKGTKTMNAGNAAAASAIDDKVDADAAAALTALITKCLAENAGNTEEYCRGTFLP